MHGRAGIERGLLVRDRRQLLPLDHERARPRPRPRRACGATTMATGSPTQQARSTAIGYCGADFMPGKQVSVPTQGPVQSLASSAPVMTRATPGWRLASAASMREDPGVGEGAAHEGGMQHARQREVVGVAAAAGHGALGAGARQGAADVAVGLGRTGVWRVLSLTAGCPFASRRLPASLDGIDDGVVAGAAAVVAGQERADLLAASWAAARAAARPPSSACRACRSRTAGRCAATNASCRSAISPVSVRPSMVTTSPPSACTASIRQPRTTAPSTRTEQAPQTPCSQPEMRAGEAELGAQEVDEMLAHRHRARRLRSPLTVSAICCVSSCSCRPRSRSTHSVERAPRQHALQMQAQLGAALGVGHRVPGRAPGQQPPHRALAASSRLPVMAAARRRASVGLSSLPK